MNRTITMIILLVVISLSVGYIIYYYVEVFDTQVAKVQDLSVSTDRQRDILQEIEKNSLDATNQTYTFTNEQLPGFSFQYDDSVTIKVKDFDHPSISENVVPDYLPSCNESCMKIEIDKDGYTLTLFFERSLDTEGLICSSNLTYSDIGDNWYKIVTPTQVVYSNNAFTNYTTSEYAIGPTDPSDFWYVQPNTFYKLCMGADGDFLPASLNTGKEYGILFEYPKIITSNGDQIDTTTFDFIITSIKGI